METLLGRLVTSLGDLLECHRRVQPLSPHFGGQTGCVEPMDSQRLLNSSGDVGQAVLQFRDAEPADVHAIAEVYLASWRAGYEGLLRDDVLDQQAAIRRSYDWLEAIESPSAAVILGINAGRVAGVVEAREELADPERDLPEILMLYVAPSSWGSPLAKELLTAGSSWIRNRGHEVARLRVVEKHARARRFYEREGWTLDHDMPPGSNGFFRLIYYSRRLGRGLH